MNYGPPKPDNTSLMTVLALALLIALVALIVLRRC